MKRRISLFLILYVLQSGTAKVAEAAWQVGFKDPSYFSKLYQEEFGELPREARK